MLRAADIFAQPNIEPEPFGLSIIEALDAGLIPQCRVRRDNLAGRGLAAVLGYEECGSHLTVQLRR